MRRPQYKELATVFTESLTTTLEPAADADGHILTYTILSSIDIGIIRFTANNNNVSSFNPQFTFTPDGQGSVNVTYTVDDCTGNTLIALADQYNNGVFMYNRSNCLNATGNILLTSRAPSGLPGVIAGTLALQEDQAVYPTGKLTREAGSDAKMESSLRFVFKEAPSLGAVDFLCNTEAGKSRYCPPCHRNACRTLVC